MTVIHTSGVSDSPMWISVAGIVKVLVPVTILVLVPKCPACIAGYVLVFTGIGLSLPVASFIRCMLVALCITALLYLMYLYVRRVVIYCFAS